MTCTDNPPSWQIYRIFIVGIQQLNQFKNRCKQGQKKAPFGAFLL